MEKEINIRFVTEDIAKQLQIKGFNEPCIAKYTKFNLSDKKVDIYPQSQNFFKGPGFNVCSNSDYPGGVIDGIPKFTAPSYQQVIDWFVEKHDIEIYTKRIGQGEDAEWEWWSNYGEHSLKSFKDKYEALDEAILSKLEELT